LNPPFSQRSRELVEIRFGDAAVKCSIALAFVMRALNFLSANGILAAILPLGCFDRAIDRDAWRLISARFGVKECHSLDEYTFKNARARSKLVLVSKEFASGRPSPTRALAVEGNVAVRLERGSYQMHFADSGPKQKRWQLVHTSNLVDGEIHGRMRLVTHRHVSGPALLIPRVGKLDRRKIALLEKGREVVLSDCVFAVLFESEADVIASRHRLLADWTAFSSLYGGTGAPYTTSAKLLAFLSALLSETRRMAA
jgi:hypothetical protein